MTQCRLQTTPAEYSGGGLGYVPNFVSPASVTLAVLTRCRSVSDGRPAIAQSALCNAR